MAETASQETANLGIEELRQRVAHLEREKAQLEAELVATRAENHDFASLCVEAQSQAQAMTSLYVASHRLHATLDADQVLVIVQEILVELVGAEEFGVFLFDKNRTVLELVTNEGVDRRVPKSLPAGEGVVGDVASSGEAFFFEAGSPAGRGSGLPFAAVPLCLNDDTGGVIVIYKLLKQKAMLSNVDHQVLELLAGHAATAVVKARLHDAMDRKLKTVEGFVQMMKPPIR